jgi:hypothetical protein
MIALKGHDLSRAKIAEKQEGFTGCGKTQFEGLCNKGTALAGPNSSAE